MTWAVWLAFVAACFVFSLSPGAGAVSTMSTSLAQGPRRAMANILGLQIALAVHIVVVAAGLGMLLSSSVWTFTALKLIGALYLVWLGVQKWREAPTLAVAGVRIEGGLWRLVRTGMLVNLTNPKSIIFLAAFLPQFVQAGSPQASQYAILGLTVLAMDWLVMIGYALLAASLRTVMATPVAMRRGNRLFGSLFIGAGLALASAKAA
ncbi:MAG: homoserine/homoserine lactone efflux protein [Deltaproteobacteria bacterium]|nr:homoserine/homoserine lactone efflux protein [Deltaproteobacteria bacterium]